MTAGTPRRRITNVFKQERLNLSGVWARVRLHGELRRVGCVRFAKKEFLAESLGEVSMALLRNIKTAFDPNRILNPGKVC